MSSEQASEYSKNSYKSILADLNRQLQDLGRDIDIVRGREFRSNNSILDGKLKKNLYEGLTRRQNIKMLFQFQIYQKYQLTFIRKTILLRSAFVFGLFFPCSLFPVDWNFMSNLK